MNRPPDAPRPRGDPRRRLHDLRRFVLARETLVVDVADATLAALVTALAIEHPTLDEPPFSGAPRTLRHARRVARLARDLRDALASYGDAVDETLVAPPSDDLPF